MALITINRSLSRKGETLKAEQTSYNKFENAHDLAKLKKHLAQVVEKLAVQDKGPPATATTLKELTPQERHHREHSIIRESDEHPSLQEDAGEGTSGSDLRS